MSDMDKKTLDRAQMHLLKETWQRYARRLAIKDGIMKHYADCFIEGPDPVYNPDGSRR